MIFCPPLCLSLRLRMPAPFLSCRQTDGPEFIMRVRLSRSRVSIQHFDGSAESSATIGTFSGQRLTDCLPSFFLPFCLMMPVACLTLSSITETAIQHWQSRGKFIPFGCRTSEVTNCTAELALSTVSLSPI